MPIYEYRCEDCGHELEKMQKISEAPLTECPACGKPTLKKKISAAGFRLKGSGWYETDFKKDKDKKKNLHEGGEKKESEKKESKPTESTSTGGGDKTPAKPAESKPAASSSAA